MQCLASFRYTETEPSGQFPECHEKQFRFLHVDISGYEFAIADKDTYPFIVKCID